MDLPAVRPMHRDDLGGAASLHAAELADGFLASLGPRFLRAYLATFLDTAGAVAVVVDGPDGELGGFLVGSTVPGHHRLALRLHWRSLVLAAAAGLAVRPVVAARLLRTRARRYLRGARSAARAGRDAASTPRPRPARSAVLLHVAVAPALRGRSVGRALVEAFVEQARAAGSERAVLVTFGESATAFYERSGWTRVGEHTDDDGRTHIRFALEL